MAGSVRNGVILGAVTGLLATKAEIAIWISNQLAKILPDSFYILDSWTIPIAGILIGMAVGYYVEKR